MKSFKSATNLFVGPYVKGQGHMTFRAQISTLTGFFNCHQIWYKHGFLEGGIYDCMKISNGKVFQHVILMKAGP